MVEYTLSQCYLKTTLSGNIMTYMEEKKLRNLTVKVAREHSSMFYFILESNDNLAFYSTLAFEKESLFRAINIFCTPELSVELDNMIEHFQQKYSLEILKDEMVKDFL